MGKERSFVMILTRKPQNSLWALYEGYGGLLVDGNAGVHCSEEGGEVFHWGPVLSVSKWVELAASWIQIWKKFLSWIIWSPVHGCTTVHGTLKGKRYGRGVEIVATCTAILEGKGGWEWIFLVVLSEATLQQDLSPCYCPLGVYYCHQKPRSVRNFKMTDFSSSFKYLQDSVNKVLYLAVRRHCFTCCTRPTQI